MVEVFGRLRGDWACSIAGVAVGVTDGVVELRGISRWSENRDRAIETARQVRGVNEVISSVEVMGR